MKKLLLAALLLSGITFLAPRAEAGSYRTVFAGYDRCGRPVYQRVYSSSRCEPRSSYYYNAPTYYRSSSYRSYDYGRRYDSDRSHCNTRSYSTRPRFAISFGF